MQAIDECAANMNGHRFGPHGYKGEIQCQWCGEAEPVASPTSRNTREGRFVGLAWGKVIRSHSTLFRRRVRAAKARAIERGRIVKQAGIPHTVLRFLDQQGAQ